MEKLEKGKQVKSKVGGNKKKITKQKESQKTTGKSMNKFLILLRKKTNKINKLLVRLILKESERENTKISQIKADPINPNDIKKKVR